MTNFKIGDIVMLKSGGPDMEVIGFSPNERIWCSWNNGYGFLEEASYRPEMLCMRKSA